jgi:two-component system response regulator NreC
MPGRLQLAPPLSPREADRAAVPIRVVLADDHEMVRRSVRLLLDRERDIKVVAEALDVGAVARHVESHRPHVLVLDIRMQNGSSIEAIGGLRAGVPDTEIVVLTMDVSPVFAKQALNAGAVGLVLKERADSDLPEAIRCAARGQEFVSPPVAARLAALREAERNDAF